MFLGNNGMLFSSMGTDTSINVKPRIINAELRQPKTDKGILKNCYGYIFLWLSSP